MVAVRLTAEVAMTIVGSARYFDTHKVPTAVRDLARHNCICLRLASSGGIYARELVENGKLVEAKISGQVTLNGAYQMLNAALSGYGLAFLPEDITQPYVKSGRLQRVLESACPRFPGLHAYYPRHRNASRALRLVVDAIRHRD